MKRYLKALLAITMFSYLDIGAAHAQMKLDMSADLIRRITHKTSLDDLAVNDTAYIYKAMCIDNGSLYVPGWTQPADLAGSTYAQTGVILRVQVLPGRRLKGTLVDAAQAQAIAKGRLSEAASLDPKAYKQAVIDYVSGLYEGDFFGTQTCEEERRQNPLRNLTLFSLDSINGVMKLSDLLASSKE